MDVDEMRWNVDVGRKNGDGCGCPHENELGWNIDEHRWIWMGMDCQKEHHWGHGWI